MSNLFSWHVKSNRKEAISEARKKLFVRGMLENWYISKCLDEDECKIIENNLHAFAMAYANNSDVIEGVPDHLIEKLIEQLTFTGLTNDVDQFTDELIQFKNAGMDEFAIRLYEKPEESMKLIANKVLPYL